MRDGKPTLLYLSESRFLWKERLREVDDHGAQSPWVQEYEIFRQFSRWKGHE